jgi:peptide subunit release factor 1 (eRF1)
VVIADKVGADLYARTGPIGDHAEGRLGGEDVVERSVDGDTENIQRSAPGGWSQRRFQQRSENTWERNASEAADAVVALADEVQAQLVVLGGDVRATGFLADALPQRIQEITRPIEAASRAEGASIEHMADDVHRLVRTVSAERLTAVLATFDEELGQHDRAVDGPAAVVTALQMATVETLLVSSKASGDRTAWVGPRPSTWRWTATT